MPFAFALPRLLAWLLAVALLALAAGCGGGNEPRQPPAVKEGTLDLRDWDFRQGRMVALDGPWEFLPGEFADPDAIGIAPFLQVPGPWNDVPAGGKPMGGHGFGTYRLTIDCYQARDLALSLPVQHSAVRYYVNGRAVAGQGVPGRAVALSRPAPIQQIVHLDDQPCPLRIVAHVSNFDIRRGGLLRSITLGTRQQVHDRREFNLARDLFCAGALVVMGLLPLMFWLTRRKDSTPLWFGLFCVTFAFQLGLVGERVLQPLIAPLGWNAYLQIVFASMYGTQTLFALFVARQYPAVFPRLALRAIVIWGVASTAVVLVTPASLFSLGVPLMMGGALAVAVVLVAVLARAVWQKRSGALLMLGGLGMFIATVMHDTLYFEHLQQLSLVPWGAMAWVSMPAILLARRFSRALSAEELRHIEQRERADLVVRSTQAGVLDWDAVEGVMSFSPRYLEMLGYPADTPQSALPPFYDMVHPDEREMVRELFRRQLRDRGARDTVRVFEARDYRLLRADGEPVWVHAEGIGLCGTDGRTLRFICSFIDISAAKRHETEMGNRVKFINDLFDSVPISLALRDTEGKHLFVNRTWEQYIGLKRESVIGTSLRDVADPAAAATLALDAEALALGPGQTLSREYDYNNRRFVQTRTVMVDSEGRRIGVLTASLDITEKYATEQALAMERERLRLLVRSTKAGFGDWDARSDSVTYTDRFKEMLGYPGDTDTSDWPSIFEMMHPNDRDKAREEFRAMIRRKSTPGFEQEPGEPMSYRLRRVDGSYIWIHAEGIAQVDENGRTVRFITSYLDVTTFHEQEETLRRSQQRLELVVRGARVGIVDWDGRTHETYYSPHFREIRGYAPDADTADWPDYFKVMIHPDDRQRVTKRWIAFIMGKGPEGPHGEYYSPEEYRMLRADGSYAWVQVSGMAVRDETGFVLRWIAAIIDITSRRAQEEALRATHDQIAAQAAQLELQNEALKENVRLREEVERIGRHDIKTPLNSIIAVPRLLREERELSADENDLLGIVERAGYRILSMVNLSLDLYKMENGSYIFRPDAVDLADLTGKVIADLRSHAASKGVKLEVVQDKAQPAYAWAEELLCYSLIANLLKNAVEASPEGQVVTVTLKPGTGEQPVVMAIHNQGAIPPAVRGNFFQKYATAGKASGTGLGAYSARLMARVQDGGIFMRTSEEEGTTISVELKAAPAGTVPVTARHAGERSRGVVPQLARLPRLDVLLVDDDEYNLLIVRRFLPTPPLVVHTAINGRIALEMATANWPDVIFMDLDMPVMGGMEAVGLLRRHEEAAGLPPCSIFALSSHDDPQTQAKALAAGFDQYLTKPVTRQAIHAVLARFAEAAGEDVQDADADDGAGGSAGKNAGNGAEGIDGARDVVIDPDMQSMIGGFVQSRLVIIDSLQNAVEAGDRTELRRLAHQLSGSFGLYGFNWAAAQSRALEASAAEVEAAHALEVASALREHLEKVVASVC